VTGTRRRSQSMRFRHLLSALLLILVLVPLATGCTSDSGTNSAAGVAPPAPPADVHSTDWRNASYSVACPGLGGPSDQQVPVTLADGSGTTAPVSWFDTPVRLQVRLVSVSYGDLTSDGRDEAVIRLSCTPEQSNGVADEIQVFGPGSELLGTPVLRNPDNSDFAPALKSLTVANGAITGSASYWAKDDPHCCPSQTRPFTFRWNAFRSAFDQS
jgi:hypothetical protein